MAEGLRVAVSCKAAGRVATRRSSRQQCLDIQGKPGEGVDGQ